MNLNKIIIFLPIFVVFSMIVNLPIANAQEDVDMLFQKGIEAYENDDPDQAFSYFEKVIEIEPNHLDALSNIGGLLSTFGKYDEAISYLDKAIEIEPNHVRALVNKGSILGSLGEFDDAIFYLDRVLEIEPDNVNALSSKGAILFEQENYDDAIFYLDRALEIEPENIDALTNKAAVLIDQKNYHDSVTYFLKILKIDRDNELAKEFLTIVKAAVGFKRVDGFTEFILRDSQGNLITYLKSPYIIVLNHTAAQNFIDSWYMSEVITVNNTSYEVFNRVYHKTYEVETVFAQTALSFDAFPALRILFAPNWGFPLLKGDSITTLYTIYKPIE